MQRELRLSKRRDFAAVQAQGRGWANRLLVLKVAPNGLDVCRFAFAVSKRVGKAVVRNLVKRRIREAIRRAPVKGGRDALFIARRDAASASFWDIKIAVEDLLRRGENLIQASKEEEDSG